MEFKRIAIPLVVGLVVVGTAGGAWALVEHGDDNESRVRGTCPAASYELSAEREDGGVEVSLELLSDAPGQTWSVELTHNAQVLVSGQRVTDEDAEIDVDAYLGDPTGSVRFNAVATGPDHAVCAAALQL